MKAIIYTPIGVVHSPYKEPRGTPIQPTASSEGEGIVEIFPEYVEGLRHLDGFSHIILLYHFHLSRGFSLQVTPFLDEAGHGVFSTRAPRRPNPIGISILPLLKIEGNLLHVRGVDIVEGTPLLDIKPYVPEFDGRTGARIGWLAEKVKKLPSTRADGRFLL